MKKSLLVLSVLAALSMALVSCGGGAGGGDEPGKSDIPAPTVKEKVIEIKASYDNYLDFDAVDEGSGYTDYSIEFKYETEDGIQACAQLMFDNDQASATINATKEYSVVSGKCLKGAQYSKWEDGKAVPTDCADKANKIQFYIQNSGYSPTSGKIYIKKAWLSADGKDDLVLFEAE